MKLTSTLVTEGGSRRSAAVFVHPACWAGAGYQRLSDTLYDHGYDESVTCIGPLDRRGRRQIMRVIERGPFHLVLEGLDGVRIEHWLGGSAA